MKNFARIIVLVALGALIVFPVAAGGILDSSSGKAKPKAAQPDAGASQPAASTAPPKAEPGTLTITGLAEYEGWYLYAVGFDDGRSAEPKTVYAAVNIGQTMMERGTEFTGGLIKNGSVSLPVWLAKYPEGDYDPDDPPPAEKTAYNGSDTVTLEVTLWETGHDSVWSSTLHWIDKIEVEAFRGITFTNGKARFDWNNYKEPERKQEK